MIKSRLSLLKHISKAVQQHTFNGCGKYSHLSSRRDTECGKIRENTDLSNSEYGHFLRSVTVHQQTACFLFSHYNVLLLSTLFHISLYHVISFNIAVFQVALFDVAFFVCAIFVLCFVDVALFPYCTLFMLQSFHVARFSCCTNSMLRFFLPCFSFFVLNSCCPLFILHFFVSHSFCVALSPNSNFHAALLCCNFVLHSSHVAFFVLHFFTFAFFFRSNFCMLNFFWVSSF